MLKKPNPAHDSEPATACDEAMMADPHPLDFDWRYDSETVDRLVGALPRYENVLCLGTPSIAVALHKAGIKTLLVDRQPGPIVPDHMAIPVEAFDAESDFDAAIIDPPWYPQHALYWSCVAARAVGVDGHVYVSLWPNSTRPAAQAEKRKLFKDIGDWADIDDTPLTLTYGTPKFERIVVEQGEARFSHSPRQGELYRFTVRQIPGRQSWPQGALWQRYVFDKYQLAVRVSSSGEGSDLDRVPGLDGWVWPYVSRRAPGLSEIDVWSSNSEVGTVRNTGPLIEKLDALCDKQQMTSYEDLIAAFNGLNHWRIPPPPYERVTRWTHQQ